MVFVGQLNKESQYHQVCEVLHLCYFTCNSVMECLIESVLIIQIDTCSLFPFFVVIWIPLSEILYYFLISMKSLCLAPKKKKKKTLKIKYQFYWIHVLFDYRFNCKFKPQFWPMFQNAFKCFIFVLNLCSMFKMIHII